ncbi:UPF0149 family protein [Sphingobium sp. AN641]|uniref:UPF0149 family protein n=1 Tax=Sphingobium sp. AN641 TaxID=3133443 RepID=UPI0030C627E5
MNQPASYLDELDQLLFDMSEEGMLLSELDGYLTGLIVSPDLVPQSQWLKPIWGDAQPAFADAEALQRFLDLVMQHYNEILGSLDRPGEYEPILETDTMTGETLWELWIDGFTKAMKLAPGGWNRVRASDDEAPKTAIIGISTLAAINDGRADFTEDEEDRWDGEAADLIPMWVQMLHEWRLENDRHKPASAKVGRNDPCPCGSGKKYKKCCGLN